MRDHKDNAVIVCSIENLDPMGVHTGDSITVAPIQTLSDREYQEMRDDGIAVLRAIGVETGGSNVQFAVDPATGRRLVIEMNPRVSRSSALASKATGFPIAKIAALLAVGFTLDEIANDITGATPASFEPALDYVVVKAPRFDFDKFPSASEPPRHLHAERGRGDGDRANLPRGVAEGPAQPGERACRAERGSRWKSPAVGDEDADLESMVPHPRRHGYSRWPRRCAEDGGVTGSSATQLHRPVVRRPDGGDLEVRSEVELAGSAHADVPSERPSATGSPIANSPISGDRLKPRSGRAGRDSA